jgi:hypothetical protein
VRAEMADHDLEDKGYKFALRNADVAVKKDGSFAITPR